MGREKMIGPRMSKAMAGKLGGRRTAEVYGGEQQRTAGHLGAVARAERHFEGDLDASIAAARKYRHLKRVWDERLGCYRTVEPVSSD